MSLPINTPEGSAMVQVSAAHDTGMRALGYLTEAMSKGPSDGFGEARLHERHFIRGSAIERIAAARRALKAADMYLKQADADLRQAGEEDR